MNTVKEPTILKFTKARNGRMLIGDSRVSLDSVYYGFRDGETPESIMQDFPPLRLAEVYGAITYILQNREAVEAYIREQESIGDRAEAKLRRKYGKEMAEFRERVFAHEAARSELVKVGA